MRRGHGDVAIGLFAMALATGYWQVARTMRDGFLSDSVGVAGFPTAIAGALALAGATLTLRGVVRPGPPEQSVGWLAHIHALVLFVMLAIYIFAMPTLGYPTALALLIAASAAYAGARGLGTLIVTSAAGSLLFWLTFTKLFGVSLPLGDWSYIWPLLDRLRTLTL